MKKFYAAVVAVLSLVASTSRGQTIIGNPTGNQTIVQPSGTYFGVIGSSVVVGGFGVSGYMVADRFEGTRYADQFPGADIGAKINAAYNDLPDSGGRIFVAPATLWGTSSCWEYSTSINFSSTAGKRVLLVGDPNKATCLHYVGTGSAVTLDWSKVQATHEDWGAGIRDLYFSGTGKNGGQTGLTLGGNNGVEGAFIQNVQFTNFAMGVKTVGGGNGLFAIYFQHCRINANGQDVRIDQAIENLTFDNCLFGGDGEFTKNDFLVTSNPPGYPEVFCTHCSFDNAQVVLNDQNSPYTSVISISQSHFESIVVPPDTEAPLRNFGGILKVKDTRFLFNVSSSIFPNEFVDCNGLAAHCVLDGNDYFFNNAGYAMPQAVYSENGARVSEVNTALVQYYSPGPTPPKQGIVTTLNTDGNAQEIHAFMPTDYGNWDIKAPQMTIRGNLNVVGNVQKSSGSFVIDDPLDPANKYLEHSFVESPEMLNIYDGIAALDGQGRATVHLPRYFQALNRDFRYQLTCVGKFAPVYVEKEVNGNQFVIAGGKPGMKISWLVTGIRKDRYAEAHRIQPEADKPIKERGTYLHPELYGASSHH